MYAHGVIPYPLTYEEMLQLSELYEEDVYNVLVMLLNNNDCLFLTPQAVSFVFLMIVAALEKKYIAESITVTAPPSSETFVSFFQANCNFLMKCKG